jgi:hypothetical protein
MKELVTVLFSESILFPSHHHILLDDHHLIIVLSKPQTILELRSALLLIWLSVPHQIKFLIPAILLEYHPTILESSEEDHVMELLVPHQMKLFHQK